MSKAYKCDRCGEFFPSYKATLLVMKGQNVVDLCPNCRGMLWKWLNEYKEGEDEDTQNRE